MGKKGLTTYQLIVTFYLVLCVMFAIFFFSRANSEISGEAFKQRADSLNLRLIANYVPSSGHTKLGYHANEFSYNLDYKEGKIYVLDGKHVFGYYGKDEDAPILLDKKETSLILEGKNG